MAVLQPIRRLIEENHSLSLDPTMRFSGTWLPCHAIDLHEEGRLNPHVDSVRFSGNIVSGLSLLSDSIMRLKPQNAGAGSSSSQHFIDLILPERSLYVLSGTSRYHFTHELLPSSSLSPRARRFSIIFRDSKATSNNETP
jgi:alkylated DNA repair protein alkB family protein 7